MDKPRYAIYSPRRNAYLKKDKTWDCWFANAWYFKDKRHAVAYRNQRYPGCIVTTS